MCNNALSIKEAMGIGPWHLSQKVSEHVTGTGKTSTVREQLRSMDTDAMSYTTVNLNSFTDAPSLQPILEQPLEKKSGEALCALLPLAPMPRSPRV